MWNSRRRRAGVTAGWSLDPDRQAHAARAISPAPRPAVTLRPHDGTTTDSPTQSAADPDTITRLDTRGTLRPWPHSLIPTFLSIGSIRVFPTSRREQLNCCGPVLPTIRSGCHIKP